MFRTITRPSSGASSSKLYHAFGMFVQVSLTATWLVLPTTTYQLDSPARMYQMRDTVHSGAPDDGRIVRPKHVLQNKEK